MGRDFFSTGFYQKWSRFLGLISFLLIGYSIYIYFYKEKTPIKVDVNKVPRSQAVLSREMSSVPKSFDSYRPIFTGRDLFETPYARRGGRGGLTSETSPPEELDERIFQKYKLVGIMLVDDPRIIVESPKEKEALFLSIGEKLEGAVLKAVTGDKAVFDYHGQSFDMRLEK